MSTLVRPEVEVDDKATQTSFSLYDRDRRKLERVRIHYRLDSLSQALRRCIEDATVADRDDAEKDGPA